MEDRFHADAQRVAVLVPPRSHLWWVRLTLSPKNLWFIQDVIDQCKWNENKKPEDRRNEDQLERLQRRRRWLRRRHRLFSLSNWLWILWFPLISSRVSLRVVIKMRGKGSLSPPLTTNSIEWRYCSWCPPVLNDVLWTFFFQIEISLSYCGNCLFCVLLSSPPLSSLSSSSFTYHQSYFAPSPKKWSQTRKREVFVFTRNAHKIHFQRTWEDLSEVAEK